MLVGAAAGLGVTAVTVLALFVIGLRPRQDLEGAAFIFMQFLGQLAAGVVAGRLAAVPLGAYHGSHAALALYAVTAALTLAAGGEPGLAALVFGAVVALIIGAAGGILASMRR